jgi:hypothetical protein
LSLNIKDTKSQKYFFSFSQEYSRKKSLIQNGNEAYSNWFPNTQGNYHHFLFQDLNVYNYLDTYVKAPFPKTKTREFLILTRCNVVRYVQSHKIFLELGVSPHNVNRQGIHERIQSEEAIDAKKLRIIPAFQKQFRQMITKKSMPNNHFKGLQFNHYFDTVDLSFSHYQDTTHPKHIAVQISYLLTKKGWGFRRAVDEVLPERHRIKKKKQNVIPYIPNVLVDLNGRVGKAMMAQNFKMRRGSLSLQTFKNRVKFSSSLSVTKRHGTRNVKVWVSLTK